MAEPSHDRLTENALRGIGLAVWAFVAAPTVWAAAEHPLPRAFAVVGAYVAFGAAFLWATGSGALAGRRSALLVQSALALPLCFVGSARFEGALLAVVAAQAPGLVPLRWAVLWLVGQAAPLLIAIWPTHGLFGSLQATGAYLAFGGFAMGVVHLRQRLAEAARLAERLRIARDLHDAVGHHLVGLGLQLQLEAARAGGATEPVAAARAIAAQALAEVRQVVGALRDEGPALDVRTLARAFPDVQVRFELSEPLEAMVPAHRQALYRCVQEGLTNAAKHGKARNVRVRLWRSREGIELSVADDGEGTAGIAFGNGLSGMRERLGLVGGGLSASSAPGEGFELRAVLPGEPA